MSLAVGSRLGQYEIVAPLGSGGMGEVYRARDSRLGRELALKMLPADVSSDRERVARFEREARAASALNHPNIITIYDIGRDDAASYIAMELVQGRTLREVLDEGSMPPRRLLPVAVQLADGLAKAHEAGIVHRDLKPDNVMITRDGLVKILDFGIAKLASAPGPAVTGAATVALDTQPGVVMGTVGYMSPEQASGREVDFRSDQFAFGAMLYEMATGARAFARPTAAETLAAIIRDDPAPLATLAPRLPLALRWVIERCLAKDPDERYAATRDLARDLATLRDHVSELTTTASGLVTPPARRLSRWALAAGGLAAAALVAAAFLLVSGRWPAPAGPTQAVRFPISIPRGATYAPAEISRGVSISPDGTRLVIEAYERGRRHLFVRRLDAEETVRIEGSIDATSHFWSPDSRFIAFFANGRLKKIPVEGGTPIDLCAATFEAVGTWNRDGTILFGQLFPPGIFRVADTGGDATAVSAPEPANNEVSHLWPQFLPDGRRFLYVGLQRRPEDGVLFRREVRLGSLDGTESRLIARLDSRVEYADGHLIFVRDGALVAQPFDPDRAELTGEPQLLSSNIHYFFGPSNAAFSVSARGILAYATAKEPLRLAWLDRTGKEVGRLGGEVVTDHFRISPDGRRVAVEIEERRTGTSDIWLFEALRGVSTRLHHDPIDEIAPVWTPDGDTLLFRSDATGPPDVYATPIATPGATRVVIADTAVQQPEDVSADGRWLLYLNGLQPAGDIFLLPLDGEPRPAPWLRTRFDEKSPRFSPDGRWIAYESDESGDPEVYMARVEGAADKRRVSVSGGSRPRWRRDGRELYYLAPGGVIMAVPVTPGPALDTGTPVPLFRGDREILNYDVTADGTRFLAAVPVEHQRDTPIRVIVNWPAALGRER